MNKNYVVALISLLVFSMISVVSASAANGVAYSANGKIESYDVPGYTGSVIVSGSWNVVIKNVNSEYQLEQFNVNYRELNIDEEIPGTKDYFEIYLTDITSVTVAGEFCIIEAHLWADKKGWDPATGKPLFVTQDRGPVVIRIQSSGIEFAADFPFIGSTLSIRSK